MRVGVLTSHPIQYQAPWFRALARELDLQVYFAHRQSAEQQAAAGYGVAFDWDIDLLAGYSHAFLHNVAREPNVYRFSGCDTPEIGERIRSGRFDAFLVNGWYLKSYLQALYACRRAHVPLLVRGDSQLATARGRAKRFAKEIAYRALLRNFGACLYVGSRNREYLAHYGVPDARLFHAPHFVDNEWFRARASSARARRSELRAELGFAQDDLIALFVGRFVPSKRPVDLVRAVAQLPASLRVVPLFVGAGPLETDIRAAMVELSVRAELIGFRNQSELPGIYAAADLIVLPSNAEETWGLVVNEAMASGIPAIVSRSCGCAPDLIDEARTGMSYPEGDTAALAAAIRALVPRLELPETEAALAAKLEAYSCARAVEGTLAGLRYAIGERRA